VTGRATLTTHADVLYVNVTLSLMPSAQDQVQAASDAVSAALQARGATDVSASDVNGVSARALSATLNDPGAGALADVTAAIADAAKPYPGVLVRTSAAFGLKNCTDVENRLYLAALADANARALRLATAAGLSLGAPTIVTPGGLANYAFPCLPRRSLSRFSTDQAQVPRDGNVEFGLFVNVTYRIVHS
jgi:uncharacterized protein YggE